MPSIKYAIDASGADRGAQQWSRATDRIIADARRASQAIEQLDRVTRAVGQGGGGGLDRFAAQFQRLPNTIRPAAASVTSFATGMRDLGSASVLAFGPLSGIGSRFSAIGALSARSNLQLGATIGIVTGVGVALVTSVKAAADYEEGMLRVAKVTNLGSAGIKALSSDLLRMSSSIGVPATELAAIAERGAQMGKDFLRSSADIATFTEQVAILTKTTNLGAAGADAAAASLGRFMQLTNTSVSQTKGLVAAIVDLGNNTNATESEILKITEELARSGTAFKVGADQLLAMGAAMASVGEHAERGGTALSQTLVRITQAASGGGTKLEQFASVVGLSTKEFQEMAHTDIGGIFARLLGALQSAGPGASQILKDLHIGSERNVKVFLAMAQHLDKFNSSLERTQTQIANPTAAMTEFEKMMEGTNAQFEKFGTGIGNLQIILGNQLLPTVNNVIHALNDMLLSAQGISPKVEETSESVRKFNAELHALSEAAPGIAVALGVLLLPIAPFIGGLTLAAGAIVQFKRMVADLAPPDAGPNIEKVTAAVGAFSGQLENATQAPDRVALALGRLDTATAQTATTNEKAAGGYDRTAGAVDGLIVKLDGQLKAQQAAAQGGVALQKAQEEINKLEAKYGELLPAQKQKIIDKMNAIYGLKDGIKAAAKESKDATKAFDSFQDGLAALGRDLDKNFKVTGLNDSQKAVVELTAKIDDLGAKAVEAGAKQIDIDKAVAAAKADLIPKQEQYNAAKAKEFEGDTLEKLREQIALRQIEIAQGPAAAHAQEIINDAKEKYGDVSREFIDGVTKSSKALDDLKDKSTVIADAFEDMISGIAAGTQELSLDGISDAFKAAFAASVKEKLSFDKIFEGNMLDLGGSVLSSVGGAFKSVFSLASSLFGGGGGGGGFIGPLLENGTTGSGGGTAGLLGFGGGGGLGILGQIALNSGGFFANSNPGVSLGLSGLSLANSGLSLATGGTGIIGTLFGAGAQSATLGSLLGASSAGQSSGILGSLLGTSVGTIGAAVGGITGGASGIYSGYQLGAGGQSTGQQAASAAGVLAGGVAVYAALSYLNVIPVLGTIIYAILVAIGALVGVLLKHTPMAAGLLRKQSEGVLDSIKTFQDLQTKLGDISESNGNFKKGSKETLGTYGSGGVRRNQLTGEDTARSRGFSDEAITSVAGFAGVFAANFFKDSTLQRDGNPVLMMAAQQSQVLSEFFSRAKMDTGQYAEFTATELHKAFTEMGVDAVKAMGLVNTLSQSYNKVLALQTDAGVDGDRKQLFGVNVAETLRGVGQIFESGEDAVPPGVHVAALAIQTLEKDGQKAFGTLNGAASDFFVKLSDDAENFDAVVNQMLQQGYEINTEEFETRLKAVVQSAQAINEAAPDLFNAATFEQGFATVIDKLKTDVKSKLGAGFIGQLFDKTNMAAAFEPVYALLDRMDEFNLSTPGGLADFMKQLGPAIGQGRENLEAYIPILKQMYDEWKKVEGQIDEALRPTKAEALADAIAQAFNGLGSLIGEAIDAGTAVLSSGGTMDQALQAFNSRFGAGLQTALKAAVFNAILDTAIIQPLIARYQPAFQYITAMGLAYGFKDPRVLEAWDTVMEQINGDVAGVGPLLLQSAADANGLDGGLTKFWAKVKADVDQIKQELAGTFTSTITSAISDAIKSGKPIDLADLAENLHTTIYAAVVNAMVEAMVSAAVIQGGLAPMLEELRVRSADAWRDGILDDDEKSGLAALITRIGKAGIELTDVMIAGLQPILDLIGGLPGVDAGGSGRDGHYETRNGDLVWVDDRSGGSSGSSHTGDETRERRTFADARAHNDDSGIQVADGDAGRRMVEQVVKPPAEAFADAMTDTVVPGLEKLGDSVGDVTAALDALKRLLGSTGGTDTTDVTDGGGSGRQLPPGYKGPRVNGHALGGSFSAGQESMFITGERGPELFISRPGGYEIIPLSGSAASAMLGGGLTGFANGTGVTRPGHSEPVTAPGHGDTPAEPRPGRTGPTHVPPKPTEHVWNNPANDPANAGKDLRVTLNIEAHLEEFFKTGDWETFQEQFEQGVNESVAQGMLNAIMETGPLKAALDKFNAALTTEIDKAWKDGNLSDEDIENIKKKMLELGGPIKDIIEKLGPEMQKLFEDLGLGGNTIGKDLRSALEGAFRDFANSGDVDAANEAVTKAFREATLNGIIEALLAEGPIAEAIEKAGKTFSDELKKDMEDGVISPEEAERLRALGEQLGTDMQAAFAGLDPAIAALFDGMRDKAAEAMKQAGDMIGGTLKGLLSDPKNLNFKTFSENLRGEIYQSVAGGLIDAFIQAAVIQGALAPMLAAIQLIFDAIGKKQIGVAEANVAIAEQIALMLGVLNDPAFKSAIEQLLNGVRAIGDQLDVFPDAAAAVSDAANQAQQDTCDATCGLKQDSVKLGQTVLDASGRVGDVDDVVWRATNPQGSATTPATSPTGGPASGGSPADSGWGAHEPTTGGPASNPGDGWGTAGGGASTGQNETGSGWSPKDHSPSTPDDGDDDEDSEVVDAIEELSKETREGNRKLLHAMRALAEQPLVINGKVMVGMHEFLGLLWDAKRAGKASGDDPFGGK